MPTAAVKEAADIFWKLAGQREAFPRSLEAAASWGLPVAIVKLPRLFGIDVRRYLNRTRSCMLSVPDTLSLKGLMLAAQGQGLLFINGSDSHEDQRYSLAHEIAHFLLDYHLPRLRTIELMGPSILDVLDGRRPATVAERVHAILAQAPVGLVEFRIGRSGVGASIPAFQGDTEDAADQLAIELLAPLDAVQQRLRRVCGSEPSVDDVRHQLVSTFGLPMFAAEGIADLYVGRGTKRPSFKEWLGMEK